VEILRVFGQYVWERQPATGLCVLAKVSMISVLIILGFAISVCFYRYNCGVVCVLMEAAMFVAV
jgi:hypothetical protein